MNDKVNVRFEIDPSLSEPEVVVRAGAKTKELDELVEAVESCVDKSVDSLLVYQSSILKNISRRDILRACTENRKIKIYTTSDIYEIRGTLKGLEDILDPGIFVRISRFEIINLKKVSSFDFSVSGTIKVTFENDSSTWVARRYVKSIQQILHGTAREENDRNE